MIPSTQRASDPGDCGCPVDPGSGGGCPVGPGPKTQELPEGEDQGAAAQTAQRAAYARMRIPQPVGGFPQAAVLAQITPAHGGQWSAVLQRQGSLGTFATLAAAMAAAYGAMAHG